MKIKTNLKAGSNLDIDCNKTDNRAYSAGYDDGNDDCYWECNKPC
jgi:hypothetical protein